MTYFLRSILVIYLCLCSWFSVPARAQTQTSGNVVYTTLNPAPLGASYTWSGFITTDSGSGGLSGGNIPAYNPTSGQFMFGYTQSTIAYSIALQSALSGTGISLSGIQYGLQYFNQDYSRGTLSTTVSLQNSNGATLESYYHSLPQTTNGWTNFDQTKTFTNPYLLANVGNATMTFTGKDDRFWAGYYGPQFRNPYMKFDYTVDQCAANPLSSPDCPGYATTYFNQQCSISALYNPGCPGYTVAYHDQQCAANPLYMSDCLGYQEAYAKKNLLKSDSTTTTNTESTTTAKTDPVSIATTSTTTSTTSPTSVTSVTSVISSPSSSPVNATSPTTTSSPPTTTAPAVTTTETKKTDTEIKSATSGGSGGPAKSRAEARAKEVVKEANNAKTFEDQSKTQGLVVGLMGFVPGFDSYSSVKIVDINGLQMNRQYSKPVVDNRSALRQLSGASDRLHQEMVDQQYGK